MTFFDLHPMDPYEARFKVIATLMLLSDLGVIRYRDNRAAKVRASDRTQPVPPRRAAHGGARLVRPPRSC